MILSEPFAELFDVHTNEYVHCVCIFAIFSKDIVFGCEKRLPTIPLINNEDLLSFQEQ